MIGDISVGMQQRVEILKVLYRGADVLILDEPTASLTPQEIEGLMEIIQNLTADGKSIILITHKLKEITASSDQCTIIRQGKYIGTVKVADVNENDLAAMMVGRDVNFKVDKKDQEVGEVVLDVKNIRAKDYRGVDILNGLNKSFVSGSLKSHHYFTKSNYLCHFMYPPVILSLLLHFEYFQQISLRFL